MPPEGPDPLRVQLEGLMAIVSELKVTLVENGVHLQTVLVQVAEIQPLQGDMREVLTEVKRFGKFEQEVDKALFTGNGSKPIVAQVEGLHGAMEAIDDKLNLHMSDGTQRRTQRISVVAATAAILAAVATLWVAFT